jgi:hypothetical protein
MFTFPGTENQSTAAWSTGISTLPIPMHDIEFDPITLDPAVCRVEHLECPCPNVSGCYAWFDTESEQVLRVGKARLLRNRLQAYWSGRDPSCSVGTCAWHWLH